MVTASTPDARVGADRELAGAQGGGRPRGGVQLLAAGRAGVAAGRELRLVASPTIWHGEPFSVAATGGWQVTSGPPESPQRRSGRLRVHQCPNQCPNSPGSLPIRPSAKAPNAPR